MIYRKASAVVQSQANGHSGGIDRALGDMKIEDEEGQEVVLDVNKAQEEEGMGEAAQCIWLARVRPEDCENIIRYTVLQGKVVKPERQLRGGFDRTKQLVSW
jgi:(2Fe-2S) ferredoxin